jgi:hypothetical protein
MYGAGLVAAGIRHKIISAMLGSFGIGYASHRGSRYPVGGVDRDVGACRSPHTQ